MADSYNRPTTTHALKHDQRARLMRSTRKVEAILGETPLFVDANSPRNSLVQASDARARAVYIIPATPRSSSLGVYLPPQASTSAPRAARPVLAVRVPNSLGSDFDSPPDSAASQVSFASLMGPYVDPERDHKLRTRKMARVVRTLGAQVPAELVFPATAPRQKRVSKRRSKQHLLQHSSGGSSGRTHGTIHEDEPEREGGGEGEGDLAGPERAASPPDSESLYSTLSGGDWVPVSHPHSHSHSRSRSQSHRKQSSQTHSHSHSHTRSAASAASDSLADSPVDSPISESSELPEDRPLGYVKGTMHRSEKGWSGEWVSAGSGSGMQNMDDVARRLRDLRLR